MTTSMENKTFVNFVYRYSVLFNTSNSANEMTQPLIEYIEDFQEDGTVNKKHDDFLFHYHQSYIPQKIAICFFVGKLDYMVFIWFEDEEIRAVFDRFYGAHPDTKTDFMIRIDPEKNKYELALYRYGLKEPQVISKSAYQLIVFKNKFEFYRSDNYNQPKGAWIW